MANGTVGVPKKLAATFITAILAFSLAATPAAAWAQSEGGSTQTGESAQVAGSSHYEGEIRITGSDQFETNVSSWDFLRFAKPYEGELYYSLKDAQTGSFIMQGEPHALDGEGASQDNVASIFSIDMATCLGEGSATPNAVFGAYPGAAGFEIAVYATKKDAKFETNAIFSGTTSPVYAKLVDDGSVAYELIGIRTHSGDAASKEMAVGSSYYRIDGSGDYVAYAASSLTPSKADGNAYVITYDKVGTTDNPSINGTITYVDQSGNIVKTDLIEGLSKEGTEAAIQSAFIAKGSYYRVINNFRTTVTLTPTSSNCVVPVVEATFEDGITPYEATINYYDATEELAALQAASAEGAGEGEGENSGVEALTSALSAKTPLWSDKVDNLSGNYTYTLPTTFSMNKAQGVKLYTFVGTDCEALTDEPDQILNLGSLPVKLGMLDENGKLTVNAIYTSELTDSIDFTLRYIDGTTGGKLGIEDEKVSVRSGEDGEFTPPSTLDVETAEGTQTYVPWAGHPSPMQFTWESLSDSSTNLLQYLYYVPEGHVAEGSRQVSVQYKDIATGAILSTRTISVSPESTTYTRIESEASFSANGESYVRLAGQDAPILHSYYTPVETYTVYYRNVNDTLNSQVIIENTQIIDTVRTTYVQRPATTTATSLTAAPALAGDGAVDGGVSEGDGTTIINDDANPLANLEGEDTTSERIIEDDANPLAASPSASEASELTMPLAIGAAIVAVAAIAFGILFARKRKRNASTGSTTTL